MRFLGLFWAAALLVVGGVCAQPAQPSAIEQAASQLGAPSFQVRKRARQTLLEAGWDARQTLLQAAESPDPETAATAQELLSQLLPGVTAQTPEKLRKLVRQYVDAKKPHEARNCVSEILKAKPLPHELVLALLDWEEDWQRRKQVGQYICQKIDSSLPKLLADGEFDLYEGYLAWAVRLERTNMIRGTVGYMHRRGKLDKLHEYAAQQAKATSSAFARRLQVECALVAGDGDEATTVAREMDDWPLLERVLTVLGRWQELAEEIAKREPEPSEQRRLGLACAWRLAGQNQKAEEVLAEVLAYDEKGNAVPLVQAAGPTATAGKPLGLLQQQGLDRSYVLPVEEAKPPELHVYGSSQGQKSPAWRCLLAAGFTGDAIQLLISSKQWRVAAELLDQQGRYEEADRLLQAAVLQAKPEEKWRWEMHRASFLRKWGDESGKETMERLLDRCRNARDEGLAPKEVTTIVHQLSWNGFRSLLPDRMPELMEYAASGDQTAPRGMAWLCAPASPLVRDWWDLLVRQAPEESVSARATRLRGFFREGLSEQETETTLKLALQPDGDAKERVLGLTVFARTCAAMGRQKEAEQAYRLAKRFANEAGNNELQQRVWAVADNVLGAEENWAELAEAWQGLGEGQPTHWLVHAANALAWGGDRAAGRKLLERAILLANGAVRQKELLDPMLEGSWRDYYARILPVVVAQSSNPGSDAVRAAHALKDYALALRIAQREWYWGVTGTSGTGATGLLTSNAALLFVECRRLIEQGKADECLAKASCAATMAPTGCWPLISIREQLAKAGAKEAADKAVLDALARFQERLGRFPGAEDMLYEFAWLSAWTQLEAETGEKYARKAVQLRPDQAYLQECLAVTLRKKGEGEQAIEAMRRCVRMSPSFRHLHRLGGWREQERKKAKPDDGDEK